MKSPIPAEARGDHIAILGKTGSGKSNAAKTLVEDDLEAGERVCVIDPTGTWYGLRLTAKGKPSPYQVVIFGGQHADIPISGANGAAIAEIIGTSSTSAVIDTRLMTVADRTRFFTDFAEALLRTIKGRLTLVIDEAHVFAPQGKVSDPRSGAMLHAANNLVSLGRGLGLRIVMISQRPAKLHKDSLTQVETLVAMRLIAPQDRTAVGDWIKECADPAEGREIMASLASLPTGDAWVWSPQINVLRRDHFRLASTFDSGRGPAEGSAPKLAALDLAEVKGRLEQVAAEVVANDPRTLKVEIARLTKELAAKPVAAPDEPLIERARQEGYHNGWLAGIEEGEKRGNVAGQALMLTRVRLAVDAIRVDQAPEPSPAPQKPAPAPRQAAPRAQATTKPAAPVIASDVTLTGPQSHLLRSLAWWAAMGHDKPSRTQLAAIAGWAPKGSTLRARLSELNQKGLVEYPIAGEVRLTDAGRAVAPEPDLSATLLDSIRAVLSGPQTALFEALLPQSEVITREELAGLVGWEPGGSTLRARLSELHQLELVEYPAKGQVALQEWVTS